MGCQNGGVEGAEVVMIESIEFTNFKALRQTMLPLAPFTLLLGPNGSGKTTVLQRYKTLQSFPEVKWVVKSTNQPRPNSGCRIFV